MHKATVRAGCYFLSGFSIQKGVLFSTVEIKIFLEVLICCFIGKWWKISLKIASCAKSYCSSGMPHASRGRIQWKGPRSPPAAPGAVPQRTPRSTKRRLKRTRVRSRRPPFLGCRNSFCLLCFFAGGERRRQAGGSQSGEEELKKQNPLALHTAEYLCLLQKWDFTACSYGISFFPPFF